MTYPAQQNPWIYTYIYIFAVGGNERTGQKEQIKYSYYKIKQDTKQVGEGTPYNTSSTGRV